MLRFHLDPEVDAASRRHATISRFVDWLDGRIGLRGKRVSDLGCGPGLYAERMAGRGAWVTGVDFSEVAIAHAVASAAEAGVSLEYREADYLRDPLPREQDVVILVYGDYCALSPDLRARLLGRVHEMLTLDGRFVFDVYSPGQMGALKEGFDAGQRFMSGFWAAGDYYGFKRTFLWPSEKISLERYLIATPVRQFEIFNWMQYFTPDKIADELKTAGFTVEAQLEFDSGEPWLGGPTPITLVARSQ
jgi:SAM-dependent methyltransferase